MDSAADRSTRPRIHVLVAARNEAERIGATLIALQRAFPGARIWVADDGSTDATAQIARAAGARVVRSERPIGKGGAVTHAALAAVDEARTIGRGRAVTQAALAAVDEARVTTGDPAYTSLFVLCDGDLGDTAAALVALTDAVARGDAELAVGAFATRVGGGIGLALGFARWAIRRRCGLRTSAPISGQRALSERTLRDVLPFAHGFGMEVAMTIDAVRAEHRVVEIELDLAHRASGRTLAGFIHRGRQLVDFVRVYLSRR